MSIDILVGTFKGHSGCIHALAVCAQNGAYMLARQTSVYITLSSFGIYQVTPMSKHFLLIKVRFDLWSCLKKDRVILISGSLDETIKVWDLDNYAVTKTLRGHKINIVRLSVYSHDENL